MAVVAFVSIIHWKYKFVIYRDRTSSGGKKNTCQIAGVPHNYEKSGYLCFAFLLHNRKETESTD